MLEFVARPAVLAPAVFLVGYVIYQLFFKPSRLPKLPILGAREGDWFPLLQAKWRNTRDFKAAMKLSYEQYRDQAVIVPLAGSGDTVLLPRSEIQFVTDQPDTVLNMHAQAIESLQTDYTCMDPYLIHNPVHQKLIVTTLTNQIGNLVPEVVEETAWGFEQHWGSGTEYKEVCVYDTMRRIIGSVTNRVFVGLPKCRDPALLDVGMAYAQDVPITSNLLRLVWKPIRPLAALFITLPNRIHTRQFERILRPEIERRLTEFEARQRDPEDKSIEAERNDFLQWSISQAKASGDPYMWKPSTLAGRILLLNFAAIHTSSFSITNAILDLVASKQEYLDELRAEIESVLGEHGGEWNKRALAKMEKLDSVMRESARMNSFVTVGLARAVVARDGITTPSGVKIPYGATVVVPSYPVLQDDSVYPDAQTFRPFRFSDQRSDDSVEYVKRAAKAFASTSNDYLAFGHGRNACPGRFFAANELKLILAHLVLNYDLEMQPSRPRNKWYGLNRVPPMEATIRVRRRVKD
ncbi:cytochrome P450 [Diplogelasinospora grovesii]|uniref:Cytochrome P450 n=1 Tax=Diplogelasinospora grovesii TaxID=303347 RepID=A0AAN6S2X4_9PEZI|nr:cytochrome P450 [Diplogelasinospora grovesii]